MQKYIRFVNTSLEASGWKKLTNPTVGRGQTAFPKKPADQQRLGIRFEYDGEITVDGIECHKYQMQPNAGDDIPSTVKAWRNANGGTHAVMADVFIPKDGTKEDVAEAIKAAGSTIQGV